MIAVIARSAGCARVVDGRLLAGPRVGDPVQWDKCKFNAATDTDDASLRKRQCGRIVVPVDYAHPDGDVAVLVLVDSPPRARRSARW